MRPSAGSSITSMIPSSEPDAADLAARALYVDWVRDWSTLRRFIAERLHDDLSTLTPRLLVLAAMGQTLKLPPFERTELLRPLFVQWTDRSAYDPIHHRHHFTPRLPLRGHVYIKGERTSWDNGHFHLVDPDQQWTAYESLDFSPWI